MKPIIIDECHGESLLAGSYFRGRLKNTYQSVPGGGLSYYGQSSVKVHARPSALRIAIMRELENVEFARKDGLS